MSEARSTPSVPPFLWMIGQLELLGELRVGLMHESARTPQKFMYLSIRGVEIGGDGILRSVSAHGASLEECARQLFHDLSQVDDGLYVVIEGYRDSRRAVRWHGGLGSWVPVKEALNV